MKAVDPRLFFSRVLLWPGANAPGFSGRSAWVPSAITGTLASPVLAIPLAGPFITAASDRNAEGAAIFWLAFDGVQQVAGVAMFIAGFAARRTVLLRDDVRSAKPWWVPMPMSFGKGSAGLGFRGTM